MHSVLESTPPLAHLTLAIAAAISLISLFYLVFLYVDYEKIKGIPEIPGGTLLAGHLYKLGNDHASTAEAWSAEYGWPVFQIRMGYRRAIVINSFDAAREWLVKNQYATIDRPWFHTFHGVISKTSGKYYTFENQKKTELTVANSSGNDWDKSLG